jgi:hypothetical protein
MLDNVEEPKTASDALKELKHRYQDLADSATHYFGTTNPILVDAMIQALITHAGHTEASWRRKCMAAFASGDAVNTMRKATNQ